MYNQLTAEIIEQIKAVSDHVFVGEEINPDYAKDEMPIYGTKMPELAVQPRSTEEVAAVMKICYDNNIPVTPRGAGTGLAGGAVPLYGGVLIDISKMNKIKSYDMENFVVEIEAGVLLNDLAEDCLSQGMLYPPDPGEKFACVGGNVAKVVVPIIIFAIIIIAILTVYYDQMDKKEYISSSVCFIYGKS